jgi:hypothetical protein
VSAVGRFLASCWLAAAGLAVAATPPAVAPNLVRVLEGRYEHRELADGKVVGEERFRLSVYADGSRSVSIWNDLVARASQMSVQLSVDRAFRPLEAHARYWSAGRYRGSAWIRLDGDTLRLDSSAGGAPHSEVLSAPARISLGTHPVSADGWHIAAADFVNGRASARTFTLDPSGDSARPLLGKLGDLAIERVGEESVDVPAGRFDAVRYRLAGLSDYWIFGPDALVARAQVRSREYLLVELRTIK